MTQQDALKKSLKLVEDSKIALIGNVDDDGFPGIKAMLNLKHEGLKKFWFSTNTSSKRIRHL